MVMASTKVTQQERNDIPPFSSSLYLVPVFHLLLSFFVVGKEWALPLSAATDCAVLPSHRVLQWS